MYKRNVVTQDYGKPSLVLLGLDFLEWIQSNFKGLATIFSQMSWRRRIVRGEKIELLAV
jgi:hypothetical protein